MRNRLAAFAALALLIGLPASAATASSCGSIEDQIATLETALATYARPNNWAFGSPGSVGVSFIQTALDELHAQLATCRPPPRTPALTVAAVRSWTSVPDPQIAVGHKYVASVDTGRIVFYDKATMRRVAVGPGFAYPESPLRGTTLFTDLMHTIDHQLALPANVCDPGDLNFNGLFDRTNPDKVIPGCFYEAYDTRVVYDAPRHRFWIEAALRNQLWRCRGQGLVPGAHIGSIKQDPDPINGKLHKCHSNWNRSWAHRFIAIAVSQVDANGEEDLSLPFHRYALVDQYADWPLMAVHGKYLLLTHHAVGSALDVFDAEALANGLGDNTSLQVKPLVRLPFNWFRVGKIAPTSPLYVVNVHGSPDEPAYVVATHGPALIVSALVPGTLGPRLVHSAIVWLSRPLGAVYHNPVYRNGKLYLTATTADKSGRYEARVLRIPAALNENASAVVATGYGSPGFLNYRVAGPKSGFSYELPAVDVNAAEDMVVVFERGRRELFIPFSVRYSTFYHNSRSLSPSAPLYDGSSLIVIDRPGDPVGVVDLGGIAVDPSDDLTIWMSHAYSVSTNYHAVIGAVKP